MLEFFKNLGYFSGYVLKSGLALGYAESIYKENTKPELTNKEKNVLAITAGAYAFGPYKRLDGCQNLFDICSALLSISANLEEHPCKKTIDMIVQKSLQEESPSLADLLRPWRLKTQFE